MNWHILYRPRSPSLVYSSYKRTNFIHNQTAFPFFTEDGQLLLQLPILVKHTIVIPEYAA